MKNLFLLIVIGLSTGITGCATEKLYYGPSLPDNQIATLNRGDLGQILISIDEHRSINHFYFNKAIDILPGQHAIVATYGDGFRTGKAQALNFDAQAGESYTLKSIFTDKVWHPIIIENTSKREVSTAALNYIPANTPTISINLIPMYGYPEIQKTTRQKQVDEVFIKATIKNSGSRHQGSMELAALAWQKRHNNNLDAAMRRFNQSWLLDDQYYQSYWGFGALYLSKGQPKQAMVFFEKALTLIDEKKEKHRLLVDTARAYASQAITSQKSDASASKEFYTKALALIEDALKLAPHYDKALQVKNIIINEQKN